MFTGFILDVNFTIGDKDPVIDKYAISMCLPTDDKSIQAAHIARSIYLDLCKQLDVAPQSIIRIVYDDEK